MYVLTSPFMKMKLKCVDLNPQCYTTCLVGQEGLRINGALAAVVWSGVAAMWVIILEPQDGFSKGNSTES